jgi:hypothetical protein
VIRVAPSEEPDRFDERCRKRGAAWLREHPEAARPRDYWLEFREDLMRAFGERCGYTALLDLNGTFDHFHCYRYAPSLAHEWTNYRYATSWVNSSKQDAAPGTFMDPFEVENGWFKIIIPTMELVVVKERVPPHLLALAEQTLRNLPIGRHERVIKNRRYYYQRYTRGDISLRMLNIWAPQIAAAVAKRTLADAHRDGRLALFVGAGLGIGSDLQEMFPAWQEIPQNPACSSVLDHLRHDIIPLFVGDDMSDPRALERSLGASADALHTSANQRFVLMRNPSDTDVDRYQRDYHAVVICYSDHAELRSYLGELARAGRSGPSPCMTKA